MSVAIFEINPRWPDAPPICIYENLPAFKTEKELSNYKDSSNPLTSIYEKWKCEKCGCYHYLASGPAPAGASSGNARSFTPQVPQYRKTV